MNLSIFLKKLHNIIFYFVYDKMYYVNINITFYILLFYKIMYCEFIFILIYHFSFSYKLLIIIFNIYRLHVKNYTFVTFIIIYIGYKVEGLNIHQLQYFIIHYKINKYFITYCTNMQFDYNVVYDNKELFNYYIKHNKIIKNNDFIEYCFEKDNTIIIDYMNLSKTYILDHITINNTHFLKLCDINKIIFTNDFFHINMINDRIINNRMIINFKFLEKNHNNFDYIKGYQFIKLNKKYFSNKYIAYYTSKFIFRDPIMNYEKKSLKYIIQIINNSIKFYVNHYIIMYYDYTNDKKGTELLINTFYKYCKIESLLIFLEPSSLYFHKKFIHLVNNYYDILSYNNNINPAYATIHKYIKRYHYDIYETLLQLNFKEKHLTKTILQKIDKL